MSTREVLESNHERDRIGSSWWWACDYPERPFDNTVGFAAECYGCFISGVAMVKQGHGDAPTYLEERDAESHRLADLLVDAGLKYGHFDRSGLDPRVLSPQTEKGTR